MPDLLLDEELQKSLPLDLRFLLSKELKARGFDVSALEPTTSIAEIGDGLPTADQLSNAVKDALRGNLSGSDLNQWLTSYAEKGGTFHETNLAAWFLAAVAMDAEEVGKLICSIDANCTRPTGGFKEIDANFSNSVLLLGDPMRTVKELMHFPDAPPAIKRCPEGLQLEGYSLLSMSVFLNSSWGVKTLLASGADSNSRNSRAKGGDMSSPRPLLVAAALGYDELFSVLLQKGGDLSRPFGGRMLKTSVEMGSPNMFWTAGKPFGLVFEACIKSPSVEIRKMVCTWLDSLPPFKLEKLLAKIAVDELGQLRLSELEASRLANRTDCLGIPVRKPSTSL